MRLVAGADGVLFGEAIEAEGALGPELTELNASALTSDRRYRDRSEFFEDRFGGSGPCEGSTIAVVGVDVACDRVLQIVDGMEGSASDLAACNGREEAPRRR